MRAEAGDGEATERFELLHGFLTGEGEDIPYKEAAERLGMTEGAVKVAVHRLRQRFGSVLREEVARTLADPDDVDDEIRHLFAAFER
jgi:RNA polymerase sigma-70 factor (ECF subfamily)